MSDSYITYGITTDAGDLATEMLNYLMEAFPGWTPAEGNLETFLAYAVARTEAETRDVASLVPAAIFRDFGQSVVNLPAIDGAAAEVPSTWTVRDSAGYTISAGTLVAFTPTGSSQAYFSVRNDVVIAPGSQSTAAGEVVLISVALGTAYNGFPVQTISLVDALAFVQSVVTTDVTAGGVDAETDDAYLDRLRADLKLLSPRPILPNDFAVLAKNIAGVDQSVAIDGFNPADGTSGNQRMVTVAVAAADGTAVNADVKAAVVAYLQGLREVNFVVNVVDPTYTAVNVTATVKALPGFDASVVQATATATVNDYLSPINWDWSPIVRYNELISLLDGVTGVSYVDTISVPSGNLALPGVASLVTPGAVNISVIAG